MILKKTSTNYSINNALYGNTIENVGKRLKIKFMKKDNDEDFIKQLSKLNFNGTHNSYTIYNSYTFKPKEVSLDKPSYLKFAILELSKLLMSETSFDNQSYFGDKLIQFHYMVTDSFVLSMKTNNVIKDSKNLKNLSVFSSLNENHQLYITKNFLVNSLKELIKTFL